jgi:hypothetical protein
MYHTLYAIYSEPRHKLSRVVRGDRWATGIILGNQFWDLSSAPLTKLQYLFSQSISNFFVRAEHKNYCTHGACSETAIKTKY